MKAAIDRSHDVSHDQSEMPIEIIICVAIGLKKARIREKIESITQMVSKRFRREDRYHV